MPPTTTYSFGDIALVPFTFTDESGVKKRPAVVLSSAAHHAQRRDVIIMAATNQVRPTLAFGELLFSRLGQVQDRDPKTLRGVLRTVFG
jgi:mRNA interferase MazF